MTKKPGRPKGWRIDADRIRKRIKALSLTHERLQREAVKKGEHLTVSGLRESLRRAKASSETIFTLCLVLGVRPSEIISDPDFPADDAREMERRLGRHRRIRIERDASAIDGTRPLIPPQDVKNVLRSVELSEAVLAGQTPSLLEAVEWCALFPALGDAHKDTPFVPGFTYNHFIQLSAVVILVDPLTDRRSVIGYCRTPGLMPFSYVHTQGLAILWTSGFLHGLGHSADLDMHEWVELAHHDSVAAEAAFTGGDDPVLLRLLAHRLNVVGHECSIAPLGMVTNDQRSETVRRVYTQYVFTVTVSLRDESDDLTGVIRDIVLGPEQPVRLAWDDERDERFIDGKGKPNRMDIAVWRAMKADGRRIDEASASLVRPFRLTRGIERTSDADRIA